MSISRTSDIFNRRITTPFLLLFPFVESHPNLEQLVEPLPSRMSLESKRSRAFDDQRASFVPRTRVPAVSVSTLSHRQTMSSSKGEPTDPELREKVKEEVKGESKGTPPPPKTYNPRAYFGNHRSIDPPD